MKHGLWSSCLPSSYRPLSYKHIFKTVGFVYFLLDKQPKTKEGEEGKRAGRQEGKEKLLIFYQSSLERILNYRQRAYTGGLALRFVFESIW